MPRASHTGDRKQPPVARRRLRAAELRTVPRRAYRRQYSSRRRSPRLASIRTIAEAVRRIRRRGSGALDGPRNVPIGSPADSGLRASASGSPTIQDGGRRYVGARTGESRHRSLSPRGHRAARCRGAEGRWHDEGRPAARSHRLGSSHQLRRHHLLVPGEPLRRPPPIFAQGRTGARARRALGIAESNHIRAAPAEGRPLPQRQPVHGGRRQVEHRSHRCAGHQRDPGQGVRGRRGRDRGRPLHGPDRAQAALRAIPRATRRCRGGDRRQQVGRGRRRSQEGRERDRALQARPVRDRGSLRARQEPRLLGGPLPVPRPDRALDRGQGRRPGPGAPDGKRRPCGVHPLAGDQGAREGSADQGARGLRHLQRDPHEPEAPALRQREGTAGAQLPRRPQGDHRAGLGRDRPPVRRRADPRRALGVPEGPPGNLVLRSRRRASVSSPRPA